MLRIVNEIQMQSAAYPHRVWSGEWTTARTVVFTP
jgi:hypothetical protein